MVLCRVGPCFFTHVCPNQEVSCLTIAFNVNPFVRATVLKRIVLSHQTLQKVIRKNEKKAFRPNNTIENQGHFGPSLKKEATLYGEFNCS